MDKKLPNGGFPPIKYCKENEKNKSFYKKKDFFILIIK